MNLSALLTALPGPTRLPAVDPDIGSVTHDSRRVTPGALFVAVRGETADGHAYIADAIRRGAAAVVAERDLAEVNSPVPYMTVPDSRQALAYLSAAINGFPARRLIMIGVTGTDGKTTTASLLHSILSRGGLRAGLVTSVNALVGGEALETGLHTTTPDAPEVQALLARMAAAGLTHCVLEVTSHALAQHRVTACEFDVAVLTNITHEHLDYHGTPEAYRAAKTLLFEGLASAALKPGQAKSAVLNCDDASHSYLAERIQAQPGHAVRVFGYGLDGPADLTAREVQHLPGGTQFVAVEAGRAGVEHYPIRTPLAGEFNISNCLAAIAAARLALALPVEVVQAGVAAVAGIPGRMERIDAGQPFTAIVDFAHTPNALARALQTARRMTAGRVIAVFGSAGLRDRAKRRLMPEISARLADLTILTAEDPRTESLDAILAEMAEACTAAGGVEHQTYWRAPDRGEALRLAVSLAGPGDVVIACGKGHEQSMCLGTTEYPWDDRTALRAALADHLRIAGPAMPWLPTG